MVTAEEALTCDDPKIVKRLRGSVKAQISCDINILSKQLSKKLGTNFNLENISPQLVKIQKKKLLEHLDSVQKLHDHYTIVRNEGDSEETEQKLIEEDENYMECIMVKVGPILDEINKYEETLSDLTKLKSLAKSNSDIRDTCLKSKKDFTLVYDRIMSEISHIEGYEDNSEMKIKSIEVLPTGSLVSNISKAFSTVRNNCNRLIEVGEEDKVLLSYEDEYKKYLDIELKLKTYDNMKKTTSPDVDTALLEGIRATPLKINKPDNLAFSGEARDFAAFKRDFLAIIVPHREPSQIGIYLKQAIPEKHKYLISNKDLHDWKGMLSVIEDELATPKIIIDQTVGEIKRMRTPTSDKAFIEFVDSLEKIQRDLTTLDQLSEIANTSILSELESKLPSQINHDWTQLVVRKKLSKKCSTEKFARFMLFLNEAKEMTRYNMCLSSGSSKNLCFVTGTMVSQAQREKKESPSRPSRAGTLPCLACNVDGATDLSACLHNMGSCLVWGSLTHRQRLALVRCVKHPFSQDGHTTEECTRDINRPCLHCKKENEHSSLLCPNFQVKKKSSANTSRRTLNLETISSKVSVENDLPPTLLYTTFALSKNGRKLGALIDNGSTDDYVLNKTAKRLNLTGQPVELITEGFGGIETKIKTKLYYVPIIDKFGRQHSLPCYGTDKITADSVLPDVASYQRMCKKFNVDPSEVERPVEIELLISMRSGHLHPNSTDSVVFNGMRLATGPLGKVFGGTNPDLRFTPIKVSCPTTSIQVDRSLTHHTKCMKAIVRQAVFTTPLQTDKEILNFFDEEQFGTHCEPRCGDCRCGSCVIGKRQMSIKDEKEYERFKSLMYLDVDGVEEDPGPYWRTDFPWTIEPDDLVDNKAAVLAVMRATEKKLSKNIEWQAIYEEQLRTLVEKKFAKEVSLEEIDTWEKSGRKSYYIAHQMAVNPQSKTTPVRCCFNSSQTYRGHSLNASWDLGPDLVNSLHSILLRFRQDLVAAQGDITKMYYMVRITEKESYMQIFMWKFSGESHIRYFKMERLVMGNKPSASLSGVALAETAKLDNFPSVYPAAFKALTSDVYVDNVFLTAPTHDILKSKIKDVEFVASHGGFFFKPFTVSGEDLPDVVIGVAVPDAIAVQEEKALGVYWDVKRDLLYVKANLQKPGKNVQRGVGNVTVEIDPLSNISIKPHLTLRACLSLHAKPFDPLGLVLPTRVIGNILFRVTLQIIKKDKKGKIPWNEVITGELKTRWLDYFSMLMQLNDIYFPRSFKPELVDPAVKPDFCTLNDGNPDAFGTVGYIRWAMLDGTHECRLMLSKSRLSPLSHKGETVRNELSGATLSARLKSWIQKNSEIEFGNYYHFLDSQIVKDMLAKESYGFNTFVGLRVAEVQQKTALTDWIHIPSKQNISDVLTKGVPPNMLGPDSEWQQGPSWLRLETSLWPTSPLSTTQSPVITAEMERFYRKTKVLANVRSDPSSIDLLISRSSNLNKLLRCLAYVMRWRYSSSIDLNSINTITSENSDIPNLIKKVRPVTASERNDALALIVAWEQRDKLSLKQTERLVPKTVTKKLVNHNFEVSHVVIGGRIKNFPIAFSGYCEEIPILPSGDLAKLIVKYYHNKFHQEVDTIVSHVRNDFWIINCRKLASSLDIKCIDCKINRKQRAAQVMGELPEFRTTIQPAFSVVGCDLWGPISIRDDVIKRGNRVTKKAWGVLYTCTFTRAVYLDVACGSSTQELLHTVRRAMCRCGEIRKIISDPGTNLIGAANELKLWREGWDLDMLTRFGCEKGIEWINISANSQHQNGISEVMIKLSKSILKSLMKSLGTQILSLNELNTVLAETAQLVNERPIGLKPNNQVDSSFLSPNSLILGRSSCRISSGPFRSDGLLLGDPSSYKDRFLLVQAITEQFWRTWMKLFFPSLVVRQKWHVEKRNVQVKDVVVVRDSNALRGEWRLAIVSKCYPDRLGKVRNVELVVKPKQGGHGQYMSTPPIEIKRHVNNVVVLVPVEDQEDVNLNGEAQDDSNSNRSQNYQVVTE